MAFSSVGGQGHAVFNMAMGGGQFAQPVKPLYPMMPPSPPPMMGMQQPMMMGGMQQQPNAHMSQFNIHQQEWQRIQMQHQQLLQQHKMLVQQHQMGQCVSAQWQQHQRQWQQHQQQWRQHQQWHRQQVQSHNQWLRTHPGYGGASAPMAPPMVQPMAQPMGAGQFGQQMGMGMGMGMMQQPGMMAPAGGGMSQLFRGQPVNNRQSTDNWHLLAGPLPLRVRPVREVVVNIRWKDQGWGNRKGLIAIFADGIFKFHMSPRAPHRMQTNQLREVRPAILQRLQYAHQIDFRYKVGGGSGHTLRIDQFSATIR